MNLADRLTGRKSYEQYYAKLAKALERPSTRASGLVSLTIFTVVFFTVFAIIPTFKTVAALNKEIKDAKTTEAKLAQKIHSLEQAETLYEQVLPQLPKLDQVLPAEPDFELLAWQIYWLADKNDVSLSSGGFGEFPFRGIPATPTKDAEANILTVDLSVQGTYLNIKNFIADLNRLDRLIRIDEATLSNKKVRSQQSTGISASLKLSAFYLAL